MIKPWQFVLGLTIVSVLTCLLTIGIMTNKQPGQIVVGTKTSENSKSIPTPMQVLVAPDREPVPVHPHIEIEQKDSKRSYTNDTCYVETLIWVYGKDGRALEKILQDVVVCDQVEAMKAEQMRRLEDTVKFLNSKLGMK